MNLMQDEYGRRRDLRSNCVFTIDPATARVFIVIECVSVVHSDGTAV